MDFLTTEGCCLLWPQVLPASLSGCPAFWYSVFEGSCSYYGLLHARVRLSKRSFPGDLLEDFGVL